MCSIKTLLWMKQHRITVRKYLHVNIIELHLIPQLFKVLY